MADEITASGDATEFVLAEVLDGLIIEATYGAFTIAPLVRMFDLRGRGTITSEHTHWPELSATDLTDGTDLTSNTAVNPTSVSATADEAGLKITVTDRHLAAAMVDLGDYAEQMGLALAKKIDTDLAAEFADFTLSAGSAGSALTNAHFLSAIHQMEVNALAGMGQPVAVLHPVQIDDLRASIAGLSGTVFGSTGSLATSPFDFGGRFNLYGVEVFPSLYCAQVNTNTDRQGAMWPMGRSLVWSVLWPVRTGVERDESLRATEVVVTSCYGDECVNTDGGVKIVSTATA